jgi:putative aldouronate transport system permease protein
VVGESIVAEGTPVPHPGKPGERPLAGPGRRPPASRRRARPWPPQGPGYRAFRVINGIILFLVVAAVLYPFLNVLAQSFSSERYIDAGQVNLWPRGWNVTTYEHVMSDPLFWNNYRNTVFYTVVSTAVAMAVTTTYAYVLSKRHLRGRKVLIGMAVFTMFFNGGIIPNYVLVSSLHMRDTVWAIALPNAINVFNLLVMKTFFENMPPELEEAAAVDGMDTYRILWRIVLPLSKAVIATMMLFYAVAFWNAWFSAFLYMDNQGLFTVTVYLRNVIDSVTSVSNDQLAPGTQVQIAANIQAVTVVLVAVPILFIYPFIQRYFVSGVMLGAVKG